MSQVVGSTILGTIAIGTGQGFQRHLFWAANDGAWWFFFIGSGSTTTLQTYRSPDGVTWTAKNTLTFGGAKTHNSDARFFDVAYKNIASTDVFHINFQHSTNAQAHCRATTAAAQITFGTDSATGTDASVPTPPTCFSVISADGSIYDSDGANGDVSAAKATNTDAGSSWTAGFAAFAGLDTSIANIAHGGCAFPIDGTKKILALYDNGGAVGASSMTNVLCKTLTTTTMSPTPATTAGTSVFTAFTAEDPNNFGACRVDDTHVHVVVRTGSNTFVHKILNGTTVSAGAAITNQNVGAGLGLAMAADGSGNVYLGIIDTDAPNSVRYVKYNGSTWGTWTAQETTTKVRKYLSFSPTLDASGNIGMVWTETNGANFDVVFSSLATAAAGGGAGKSLFQPSLDGLTRVNRAA